MYLDIVPAIFADIAWHAVRACRGRRGATSWISKLSKAFTGRVSPQVMEAIMHGEVGAMQTSRREKSAFVFRCTQLYDHV